jgi:hypothetical protein
VRFLQQRCFLIHHELIIASPALSYLADDKLLTNIVGTSRSDATEHRIVVLSQLDPNVSMRVFLKLRHFI